MIVIQFSPRPQRLRGEISEILFTTETQSSHGSTSSPRAEFLIAAHPEPSRRTRPQRLSGEPRILFETRHSTLVTPSNKSARIDQEHGREARALEQFENRICAVEEPGDPVSNSHARHDQMDITIERVTTYRLL